MAGAKTAGLPSIADVDKADQHLGYFMWDLGWFLLTSDKSSTKGAT